jgi:hypothetical protein
VPDTVFEPGYALRDLDDLRAYVTRNKHLPEVPSASEVQDGGVNVGAFCMTLLKKIEELSLYVLQQQDMIQALEGRLQRAERASGV